MTVAAKVWKPVEERPSLRLLFTPATSEEDDDDALGTREMLVGSMPDDGNVDVDVDVDGDVEVDEDGLLGGYGDGAAEAAVPCQLSNSKTMSATPTAKAAAVRREICPKAEDMEFDIASQAPR